MSIASFFANLFHPKANSIEAALVSEMVTVTQGAVAILKKDPLAGVIVADIHTLTASTLTGPAKMAQLIQQSTPAVLKYLADPALALADVVSLTGELCQSLYNDVASTSAGAAAVAVFKVAGVTLPAIVTGAASAAAAKA